MSARKILLMLFILSVALAVILAPHASQLPDGLGRVAEDIGFIGEESSLLDSPVSEYLWPGIQNEKLATSLAGLMGTVIVLVSSVLLGRMLVRRKTKDRIHERC